MDGGGSGPGSIKLHELIEKHGGEIYADLLARYGVDIHGIFDGSLPPKHALALVEALPLDSATVLAMRGGPDFYGWDRHAYLIADLIDAVLHLHHVTVAANSKNPKKVPEPDPYPRPKQKAAREPDILLRKLRGENVKTNTGVGPGSLIPLPPPKR
ncbi:hypothetical protein AB0C87_24955 [Actinomadura sp. NPDC048021]|uniref:hypothetical protein n=1 Tax=Actinomadura sp. NPDC048021 TaxID=3155385 RepID=UPI0033D69ED0